MSKGFLIDENISFEPANYKITINDKEVRLSQKECQVLEIFCANNNVVVERNAFIEPIWGNSASGDIGLNKAILLLRRKFESHDLQNIINTIPRVGYTLNAHVTELSYAEDGSHSTPPPEEEPAGIISYNEVASINDVGRKKRAYRITLASITALLLISIANLILSDSDTPVVTSKTQNGLNIIYTSSVKYEKPLLTKTSKSLSEENDYYFKALLSKEILSFILYKDKTPVSQKVFLIDQTTDIVEQLTCLDNYISNNIYMDEEPTSGLINGMIYSTKEFYSSCKKNVTYASGTLYTKATKLAHGSDKDHMMLEEFLLKTPTGEEVFHIKRYVNHLGFGTDIMRFIQKSVISDNINMRLIHTNELYSSLLSELTKDNILHTQVEPSLYISETFGGMLFYTKKYH